MKDEEIDVLYLEDNNFLSVQAMYPKKIVIPKSVYDYIADKIRREESGKLNIAITALEKLACLGNGEYYGNSIGNEIAQDALKTIMAFNSLQSVITGKEAGE